MCFNMTCTSNIKQFLSIHQQAFGVLKFPGFDVARSQKRISFIDDILIVNKRTEGEQFEIVSYCLQKSKLNFVPHLSMLQNQNLLGGDIMLHESVFCLCKII